MERSNKEVAVLVKVDVFLVRPYAVRGPFQTSVTGEIVLVEHDSQLVTMESHRATRTMLTLAKQWISYLLVGVLDYTVTRRLNFRDPDAD